MNIIKSKWRMFSIWRNKTWNTSPKKLIKENRVLIKENEILRKEIQKIKTKEFREKYEALNTDMNSFETEIADLLSLDLQKKINEELILHRKNIELQKEQITRDIVVNSINSLGVNVESQGTVKYVRIKDFPSYNEKTIGRILGRNGLNKSAFRYWTGADLEKHNEYTLFVSSYNTIKTEKAKRLLEKLCNLQMINPEEVKKQYQIVEEEFKKECIERGKNLLNKELGYAKPSDFLAERVGLLQHRYSFNQNILEHSLEVAKLCEGVAINLKLDALKAKRVGFFHDIGKSNEDCLDHVDEGISIGEKEKLEPEIINGIESHHGRVPSNNYYATILKAMDKISASREGARYNEAHIISQRIEIIFSKIKEIDWVKDVDIRNAGSRITIFIIPENFTLETMEIKRIEIKEKLNQLANQYKADFEIEILLLYSELIKHQN